MKGLDPDLAPISGWAVAVTVRSTRWRASVNPELDQRCLELAFADLCQLQPHQRLRALTQFRSIDPLLADKLQLELLLALH